MLVTARNIANSTIKLLIRLSLIVDNFLGLPIAQIFFAVESMDAIRRPSKSTSLILNMVRTILFFGRSSYSLELLAREVELSSNRF
jgi:hypothetical protein